MDNNFFHDTSIMNTIFTGLSTFIVIFVVALAILYVIAEWKKIIECITGFAVAAALFTVPAGVLWGVGHVVQKVFA